MFKLNTVFNLILAKTQVEGTIMILSEDFYISSECDTVRNEEDIENFSAGKLLSSKESGITIVGIRGHIINFYKYSSLKRDYIDLPHNFKSNSKDLINIKNKDDKCFMWCHIAYIFPALSINKNRLSKYINHENDVDYTGFQ